MTRREKPLRHKPLHQVARDLALPVGDQRELMLFREFLRSKSGRSTAYLKVYGKKP